MPPKNSLLRQWRCVPLRRIEHHLDDAFHMAIRRPGACLLEPHAPRERGSDTVRAEFFTFDSRRFDRFFRQGRQCCFTFQLIAEVLHFSEEQSLLVACGRQVRNEPIRIPREPRPVLGHIDVGHIQRLFYAPFYAPSNTIHAYSTHDETPFFAYSKMMI